MKCRILCLCACVPVMLAVPPAAIAHDDDETAIFRGCSGQLRRGA